MPPLPDRPSPPADPPAVCRNCGAALNGSYCANCGQEDRERIVPFRRFVTRQLRDFFSFDTRFFHTLAWLLRRPGFLTNEYIAGRQVRFTAPLRLYLIASFLFFFGLTVLQVDTSGIVSLTNAPPDPAPTDSITASSSPPDTISTSRPDSTEAKTFEEELSAYQQSWIKQRLVEGGKKMQEDQEGFQKSLVDGIPSMMFFLLPAFALLLKLLYVRRGILYARHFIFSLHIHAFAFLAFLLLILLPILGVPWLLEHVGVSGDLLPVGFLLSIWVYIYLAMRRVYLQSRRKTLGKLLLLTFLYFVTFFIALLTTAFITLLFF